MFGVLRSGERRDPAVFPDGLIGKHFVIPALYATSAEPIYELEEYLEGDLVVDADKTPSASFPSEEILDRIFGVLGMARSGKVRSACVARDAFLKNT